MRVPSRLMPKAIRRPQGIAGYVALAAYIAVVGGGLLYFIWATPIIASVFLAVIVALGVVETRRHHAKLRALAAQRPAGRGICDFARDFDIRLVDSWVVRAVYEELGYHFRDQGIELDVRSDDLLDELLIDPDELDFDIAEAIAERTGRILRNSEFNPYAGKVKTPRDLVYFFNAQPKKSAT